MKTTASQREPIGLLLICDTYPPVVGGSEIEAQRVSAALIGRGHRVQVLCAGGPPMPEQREWKDPAGVPVRILTRRSRGRWKDFVFACEVAWAIWRDRKQYDVVYFLMQGLHLAAGLPVARLLKKPMVMKFGGSGVVPLMRRSRMGRYELDWLRRWASRLLVLNEGMVEEALADGFPREQLLWMPNPVDVEEFRPPKPGEAEEWRRSHGLPIGVPIAIYVGRLSHEKGLRELLHGFACATRAGCDGMLLLVGDGTQRVELEDLAGKLALRPDQVRFVGRVNAPEVPYWLRACDVFTLTSPSEGFSCALVEAMATGLPSVVSEIPANRQLIDSKVHGLLVPFDDEAAIGRAFQALFQDPESGRAMGHAARRRAVENYSTGQVAERYEELFAEIMKPGWSRL